MLRAPQVVEQLVEVPTIVSYSSFQQRSAEQIVDIPVPRGRGRRRQGVLLGQSSAAFDAEQTVDIPVPGGGPHVLLPDPGASASSAVFAR